MFVAANFYGCISIAQAYVESLSKFLLAHHKMRIAKNVPLRWEKLLEAGIVSATTHDAVEVIYSDRNDYHHLNSEIPQDFNELETRAHTCIDSLYIVEADVFSHSYSSGKIVPLKPEPWNLNNEGQVFVNIRKPW